MLSFPRPSSKAMLAMDQRDLMEGAASKIFSVIMVVLSQGLQPRTVPQRSGNDRGARTGMSPWVRSRLAALASAPQGALLDGSPRSGFGPRTMGTSVVIFTEGGSDRPLGNQHGLHS